MVNTIEIVQYNPEDPTGSPAVEAVKEYGILRSRLSTAPRAHRGATHAEEIPHLKESDDGAYFILVRDADNTIIGGLKLSLNTGNPHFSFNLRFGSGVLPYAFPNIPA